MKMRIYVIGIGILVAMLAGKVSAQVNMRVLKRFLHISCSEYMK